MQQRRSPGRRGHRQRATVQDALLWHRRLCRASQGAVMWNSWLAGWLTGWVAKTLATGNQAAWEASQAGS